MKKNDSGTSKKLAQFGKRLCRNGGWKLLSLVLAICLWGGIVAQDTSLLREKTIPDVKITVTNASSLKQAGFIIVSDLSSLPPVTIKAQVPQGNYSTASSEKYTVRADLSHITAPGTQTVPLTGSANSSSLYGTVSRISEPEITVVVEEYASRTRIPVQLVSSGEIHGSYYGSSVTLSPAYVDIAGPKSVVDAVARCVVLYHPEELTEETLASGEVHTSLPFSLQDNEGNELDTTNLTIISENATLKNILVSQTFYPLVSAKVNTSNLIYGTPAEGYEITSVTIEPETVLVALREQTDEPLNIIPIGRVNVNGKNCDVVQGVSLYHPDSIVSFSTGTLLVTVTIEEVKEQ